MRKSVSVFLTLVLFALAIIYAYMGWRLAEPNVIWLVLALPFIAVAAYPFVTMSVRHGSGSIASAIGQWAGYLGMGFLSFLAPLVIARDLLLLPLISLGVPGLSSAFSPAGNLSLLLIATLLLALGIQSAASGPRVKEVEIPIPDLPESLIGYKIAQISDLHVGPTIRRKYVEKVVALTNAIGADLIAITGDIADGRVPDLKEEIAPLALLSPKGRVVYVVGNHEYYWNGPEWIEEMQSLGAIVLLNSHTTIEKNGESLLIAGVLDPASAIAQRGAKPDPERAMGASDSARKARLRVLLAHHPGIASAAEGCGFDLQLSGHTHGGQFFPWTLVVRRVHKFHSGRFTSGRMQVYVNPGTGSWGPPIRLGTRTEITSIRLTRA